MITINVYTIYTICNSTHFLFPVNVNQKLRKEK